MKLLFITRTYFPLKDGIQAVTQYTAEELVKLGHEVSVYCARFNSDMEEEIHNGVVIRRYGLYGSRKEKEQYINDVIRTADTMDYVIFVGIQFISSEILLPYWNKINSRKVLYMHGMWDFPWQKHDFASLRAFFGKIYADIRLSLPYRYYLGKIARTVSFSTQLYEQDPCVNHFSRYGIKDQIIITNAVDDMFWKPQEQMVPELKGHDYILCVGNYVYPKNQEMSLRAYYQSGTRLPMVYIGGSRTDDYYHLVALRDDLDCRYGKRDVKIMTDVPREHMAGVFSHSCFFIMSSIYEKQPVAVFEAMASKKAFISTSVGCVRYLPGGILADSVDEMAAAIKTLSDDECMRTSLAGRGYEYAVRNCNLHSNVKKFETRLIEGLK